MAPAARRRSAGSKAGPAKGASSSGKPKKGSAAAPKKAAAAAAAAASSPKKKAAAKAPATSSTTTTTTTNTTTNTKGAAGSTGKAGKAGGPRFFLMKSEPDTFSIAQLAALPRQTSCWEGVRNYQARNLMRDQMRVGDQAFFYHSSCKVPGIVGLVEIVKEAYPDHFQFDKASPYYDAGASKESPRWLMVDVQLKETLPHMVTLEELRAEAAKPQSPLQGMLLLQRGSRLSVQPVQPAEWAHIMGMIAAKKATEG